MYDLDPGTKDRQNTFTHMCSNCGRNLPTEYRFTVVLFMCSVLEGLERRLQIKTDFYDYRHSSPLTHLAVSPVELPLNLINKTKSEKKTFKKKCT